MIICSPQEFCFLSSIVHFMWWLVTILQIYKVSKATKQQRCKWGKTLSKKWEKLFSPQKDLVEVDAAHQLFYQQTLKSGTVAFLSVCLILREGQQKDQRGTFQGRVNKKGIIYILFLISGKFILGIIGYIKGSCCWSLWQDKDGLKRLI